MLKTRQTRIIIILTSITILSIIFVWTWAGPTFIAPIINHTNGKVEFTSTHYTRFITISNSSGIYPYKQNYTNPFNYTTSTNTIFGIKIQYNVSEFKNYIVTNYSISTPGFTIVKTSPSLPVTVQGSDPFIIEIYIKSPSNSYVGSLDYSAHIEKQN